MKCAMCHEGHTQPGKTSVTLERGDTVIVFRGVPADVCTTCGMDYLDEEVGRVLERVFEHELAHKVQFAVRQFDMASV